MEKKTQYLIGAGVLIGAAVLYSRLHSKKTTAEESAPLYATGASPEAGAEREAAGAQVAAAEQRGQFEVAEAKQGAELEFAHELLHAYETRPSGVEEITKAKDILSELGLVNSGVAGTGNTQMTPASTTSSNSEAGAHTAAAPPPAVTGSKIQPFEPVPNSAHNWNLSTTGPTAGHYFYQGTYEGKPVHIYHYTGYNGFVGPHHNLVVL